MCVNLTNLRELTDGDKDIEKELFQDFIDSSALLLADLEKFISEDAFEEWRKSAHGLKGISANLGAENLSHLSKTAQDSFEKDRTEKQQILTNLKQERDKVVAFLLSVN